MTDDKKKEVIDQVIRDWEKISNSIQDLYELYTEFDLNTIQPTKTYEVVPYSLDDWMLMIGSHIEDWEKIK